MADMVFICHLHSFRCCWPIYFFFLNISGTFCCFFSYDLKRNKNVLIVQQHTGHRVRKMRHVQHTHTAHTRIAVDMNREKKRAEASFGHIK